jgi:uncharacterized membrane protein
VKNLVRFIAGTLLAGVIAVAPIYLAFLLLLRAMSSLGRLLKPLAKLLPAWLPAEHLLSLILVATLVFLLGLVIRSAAGRSVWDRMSKSLFSRVPGYALFKGLTQRLAGDDQREEWQPVLAEIEEALVPGFIIEELPDGRSTVFVPSVPTPLAGAVYILTPERVHRLDVPFTDAIRVVSRWGSGCKGLVAAMKGGGPDKVRLTD